jgi:hypothetical protein
VQELIFRRSGWNGDVINLPLYKPSESISTEMKALERLELEKHSPENTLKDVGLSTLEGKSLHIVVGGV